MKKITQKSLVIALAYYAVAIIGCVKCDCRNSEGERYKFKEMTVLNKSYLFSGVNSYSNIYNNADTINRKEYGISIEIGFDLAYNNNKTNFPSLINSALACDCNVGQNYLSDPIDSISIFTLTDFDNTHPAGSNVNEFFKIPSTNNGAPLNYYDINYGKEYGIFAIGGQSKKEFYFFNPDDLSKTVAFDIHIIFKSGKNVAAKTKPIFLK